MKIDTGLNPHAMTPYQHFFLGCWFNLCYEESLDSDRVSVLNPLIGVQELLALYEFGTNFGGDKKRVDVGLELHELLSKNTLLDHPHYKSLKADLVEQLKPYGKKNDCCNVNSNKELISSLIRELISLLEQHYIQDAFDALEEAVAAAPGTSEEQMCDWQKTILLASDQLASALIANGAGLPDLFAFYRHILTKRQDIRPFADKFAAFRKAATNAPVNHEVTFVLRSDGLARNIGPGNNIQFGGFLIQPLSNIAQRGKAQCTATARIKAPSFTIAGTLAYEQLSEIVDSLSYTLGRESIVIERRYTVSCVGTPKPKSFVIHKPVPNPNYKFAPGKFKDFIQSMSQAAHGDGIRSSKIAAVFRLFRIAQGSENIEARFTTYWTALESITRDAFPGRHDTDEKVATAACPCIVADYVCKRLTAYIEALYHTNIRYLTLPGGESSPVKELSKVEFFRLLQNKDFTVALLDMVKPHPYFHYQLKRFVELCQLPSQLLGAFKTHESKVTRQIKRIYRARNIITHNAEKVASIEFLCAHLEHYLQTCIMGMIDVMTETPTIVSPEECFIRYHHRIKSIKNALSNNDFGPLETLIKVHQ